MLCNPMNAQILSRDGVSFYVTVSGYCGLLAGGEFHDNVPLKNTVVESDLLKVNGVDCGKIDRVGGTYFVTRSRNNCFFTMKKKKTFLNTYSYQGGGQFLGVKPAAPLYGFKHKVFINGSNVPEVVFGFDWNYANKKFETEVFRFQSKDLTFKDNEVYFEGKPCGRFEESDNDIVTFEDIHRYDYCQIYTEKNGRMYLLPHAPWIESQL